MTKPFYHDSMDFLPQDGLREQYATGDSLRLRQDIHDSYSVPRVHFSDWVLRRVAWRGDERVLDVGCGPGSYYERARAFTPYGHYCALDLYERVLGTHPGSGQVVCGDVLRLPFPSASFDVVLANHMLNLLRDVDSAIAELHRVLRPGGVLVSATNSAQSMPEFTALYRRAVMLLTAPGAGYTPPPSPSAAFTLENGPAQLRRHFYAVVRHDLPQALVFDHTEPAIRYLESGRSIREPFLPSGVRWDDVMGIMREQVDRVISHFGELVVNKLTGVLVSTDEGDFIRGYVLRKDSRATR